MWVAGVPLGPTGGHSDGRSSRDLEADGMNEQWAIIDGADAARRAVRLNHLAGADLIKIMPSGGSGSVGDDPKRQLMTNEEIKAVIDTAHSLGMKVAAHAMGKEAIDNFIRLGGDTVEHGSYGDAGSYKLYKEHGAYLVPTLAVANLMSTEFAKWGLPELVVPRVQGVEKGMADATLLARRHGILVGSGSDLLGSEQNRRGLELVLRSRLEDPLTAIRSATLDNARIMRRADRLGSIEAGKHADLIAVSGDPIAEPGLFDDPSRVMLVIKDGRVFKDTGGRVARSEALVAAR